MLKRNFISQLITRSYCIQTEVLTNKINSQFELDWNAARPYKSIPGPSKLSLIRGFLPGGKYYKKDFKQLEKILYEEYGNFVRVPGVFGKLDVIFTFDVEDHEKIFRTEGLWPMRRGLDSISYYRKVLNQKLFHKASGLIAEQGEDWGNFRSIVNPVIMQTKNIRLYIPKMNNVANQFVQRIKSIRDINTNEVPDTFESDINLWTLESIGSVALDTELGLIDGTDKNPNAIQLIQAMSTFFRLSYELDIKPSFWKILKTPTFYEMMLALETVTELTTKYIDAAILKFQENQPESEQSILQRLYKINKNIAIVMSMDLLFGGVDSTTSSIVACLIGLSKNPQKQQILRQELLEFLPDKNSPLTKENMEQMSYLRACIKEGLRYYPVTIGNMRSAGQNIILQGYQIPKHTNMIMPNLFLYKDEKHFPRSSEFLPERWLRNPKTTGQSNAMIENNSKECPVALSGNKQMNPFAYIPFGFGPRMCIGKRLVDMELEIAIAKLIRNFHVEFNYSDENIFKANVINVPNIQLKFKFVDIDK